MLMNNGKVRVTVIAVEECVEHCEARPAEPMVGRKHFNILENVLC